MLTPEQTEALVPFVLKTFNNSSELFGWLNMYVWPRFRVRKRFSRACAPGSGMAPMRTSQSLNVQNEEQEQRLASQSCPHQELLDYWLSVFESRAELHGWLVAHIWPQLPKAARKAAKSDFGDLDPDAVTPAMVDLDGAALTYREVNRRAEAGEKVLSKRTGAIVRWHEAEKKWKPLT